MGFQVIFPHDFDDYEWFEIEGKGWLDDVRIMREEGELVVSVYDEIRLPQVIRADVVRQGYFAAKRLLVVPSVTRDQIELAVSRLAEHDFSDLQEA